MPWRTLNGQRELRLLEAWPQNDDEIHVLTWQPARGYGQLLESLGWSNFAFGRATIHCRPRIPNPLGRVTKNYAHGLWVNEKLFQAYARQLVRTLGIDVLVYGIGHTVVGLPPFDVPTVRVFDYLDLVTYPEVEAAYLENSDLVICTSTVLVDRVRAFGKEAVYIPNGVSRARLARGERDRVRAALGLQDKQVVSLIGLTYSPTLYFVDALARVARQVPNVVFLLVGGGGNLLPPIVKRCQELGLPYVATGIVPSSQVADYFAASDVGLYAGDINAYQNAGCPIKILEYTAAGKPVVATDLEELRRLAFPNVRLTPPDPEAFASAIVASLREPTDFPDMTNFEWATLAQTARDTIAAAAIHGRGKQLSPSRSEKVSAAVSP